MHAVLSSLLCDRGRCSHKSSRNVCFGEGATGFQSSEQCAGTRSTRSSQESKEKAQFGASTDSCGVNVPTTAGLGTAMKVQDCEEMGTLWEWAVVGFL